MLISVPLRPNCFSASSEQLFYLPDQLISFLTFQPPSLQISFSHFPPLKSSTLKSDLLFHFLVLTLFSFWAFPIFSFTAFLFFRFSAFRLFASLFFCFSVSSLLLCFSVFSLLFSFSASQLFNFSAFRLFCFSASQLSSWLFCLSPFLLFSFLATKRRWTQPLGLSAISASQISYLSSRPLFTLLRKLSGGRKK